MFAIAQNENVLVTSSIIVRCKNFLTIESIIISNHATVHKSYISPYQGTHKSIATATLNITPL